MRILNSKYIEHVPLQQNYNNNYGGKTMFKIAVPPNMSIHAEMYFNIIFKVMLETELVQGCNMFFESVAGAPLRAQHRIIEIYGLPVQ